MLLESPQSLCDVLYSQLLILVLFLSTAQSPVPSVMLVLGGESTGLATTAGLKEMCGQIATWVNEVKDLQKSLVGK